MSGQHHAPASASPHYVTSAWGQVRLQVAGEGPTVVVLVSPTQPAAWVAGQLAELLPGRRVVAVEAPGCGGSARLRAENLSDAVAAVIEALGWLGDEDLDLVAVDLAAALAPTVAATLMPATTTLVGVDLARGWATHGLVPPSGDPTTDGSHLLALWTFLRDRRLVRADDPTLARSSGSTPPSVPELSDGFVAAATDPAAFAQWWCRAAEGFDAAMREMSAVEIDSIDDLPALLAESRAVRAGRSLAPRPVPPTAPDTDGTIWHQYIDTPLGRAHVRRVGGDSAGEARPVLVLSTGGGSSQQFAPVVSGLANGRSVASLDYFGNGLSEPRHNAPDITDLATEALAVADGLGWREFDLWGSHTGGCVALEMAIAAPSRVSRLVLEAPPMVSPDFRAELLAHYFPDLTPDRFGSHLPKVWSWRRDAFLYWPWYAVEPSSARGLGLPSPAELQRYAVGILESGETYAGAYRAAFTYDTKERLPLLRRPAILTAGPHDMLSNTLEDAAGLVPEGLLQVVRTPATAWWPNPEPDAAEATIRTYQEFLA